MLKGQKGITLVALVITIIVLLILAGITISLVIGQEGILQKAEDAGKNYQNAARYENEQLKEIDRYTTQVVHNVEANMM